MNRYTVYVTPAAWKEIKDLPGYIRQRVRRAVKAFADQPRASNSTTIRVPNLQCAVRRLRLDHWRIVYAITDNDRIVYVLAVRKRPPYDYRDLDDLLGDYPRN